MLSEHIQTVPLPRFNLSDIQENYQTGNSVDFKLVIRDLKEHRLHDATYTDEKNLDNSVLYPYMSGNPYM